jgi:hypothetical protein
MSETRHPVLLLGLLAIVTASPAMAAPVGFEEAKDVLEQPRVIAGLAKCYADATRPARIEVMLDVKPKETLSVASVTPEPSQDVTACMDRLVARVKFLPAGETLLANWTVVFDSMTASVYVVERGTPVPGVQDHSMTFKRAKKALFVGVGISGAGILTLAAAPLYIFFESMSGLFGGCDPEYGCPPMNMTPCWALIGTGSAVLATGLVILITAGVKKHEASKWLRSGGFLGLGVSPLPDRTGGLLTLAWRF